MPMPTTIQQARVTCILALFALSFSGNLQAADETRPPNIIFILTDDIRWNALGCMGNGVVQTPNIDRLAADGTLFTNMFCTTSICATSRASFLTGQYERRHGVVNFRTPLTADQFAQSFPALLRRHGYRTAMVGKWGLGGPLPKDQYDFFEGYSGQGYYYPKGKSGQAGEHLTHQLGDQVISFLDSYSDESPFLLQLYTKAAHCQDGDPWPFQPDPRYNSLFADVTIAPPTTATKHHFELLPEFLQNSEARKRWQIRFANDELYQKSVKDYFRLIAGVDDVIGRLMDKLCEQGLADETVIIFTSDNGFYLGDRGLAGKWFMHEESIRLPLVIHDPRLPESDHGREVAQMALNIDVAPTILDLAGVKAPDVMQGRSLVPLMKGEPVEWRDVFLYEHRFEHARIPKTEGVRTERWKYVRYTSVEPVYEELFDLQADPLEEHNIAGDARYHDRLEKMRRQWQDLSRQAE